MKIEGFYKYIQMDFCKTYLNFNICLSKKGKEELEFLKKIYKKTKHSKNIYQEYLKIKTFFLSN